MSTTGHGHQELPPLASEPLDVSFSHNLLEKLSNHFAEYGDAFRARSAQTKGEIYVFSHPDHVEHVLVTGHQNYTKGIGIDRVGILLGNGLMVSEGELWRRQRRMIQPAFHPQMIAGLTGLMVKANMKLREKWLISARLRQMVNVTQDMSAVSLEIVLRALIGDDLDSMTEALGENPFALLTDDTERNLAFAYKFRLFLDFFRVD